MRKNDELTIKINYLNERERLIWRYKNNITNVIKN